MGKEEEEEGKGGEGEKKIEKLSLSEEDVEIHQGQPLQQLNALCCGQ